MRKYLIAVLLSSLMMIFGCGKDDENSLTAPSTEGKGTLSFLLDGEVWRPVGTFEFPVSAQSHRLLLTVTEYDSSHNRANVLFDILISSANFNKSHSFGFKVDSLLNEGRYQFKEAVFIKNYLLIRPDIYDIIDSLSNSNFVNITKIHRDYQPYIEGEHIWGQYTMDSYVSGTFSMKLKNKNGDSVVITDGRFDLKNKSYLN